MMPATFAEAFAAARDSHAPVLWEAMSPAERAKAIYREMQRIDSERAKLRSNDSKPSKPASDPTYICFCLNRVGKIIGNLGVTAANPEEAAKEARDSWKDLAEMDVIEVCLGARMVYRTTVS